MEKFSEWMRAKTVMSIFRHARLHKLEKFVLFGASTLDQNMREERIFVRRDIKRKRWEGSKGDGEFVRRRNLSKASRIAKGVRREI